MSKIHNIFVDASVTYNRKKIYSACIGLYDDKSKFEMSKVVKIDNINSAEIRGVLEAIHYIKSNKFEGRIFTDNDNAYQLLKTKCEFEGIDLIWIPRNLNSKADALSKNHINYSSRIKTTFKVKKDTLITSTTQVQEVELNNNVQIIIDTINKYSLDKREALIKSLADTSAIGRRTYKALTTDSVSLNKNSGKSLIALAKAIMPRNFFSNSALDNKRFNEPYKLGLIPLQDLLYKLKKD